MQFIFIMLFSFGLCLQSQAEIVPALAVRTDYFPENEYALGLDLDSQSLISRIYFQNELGQKSFFSLTELESFTPIFKIKGFTVVKMRISEVVSAQSAVVELQILRNYFTGAKRSFFFKVNYNSESSKYEISDNRSGKIIHSVKVETRYAGPLPVGIFNLVTE